MQKMSQNESAITIVGSVICGVLLTLLVLNWMARKNKEFIQTAFFDKQVDVSKVESCNNKNTSMDADTFMKIGKLQAENEYLKKDVEDLKKAAVEKNDKPVPVVVAPPPNNDFRDLNHRMSSLENSLSNRLDQMQKSINDSRRVLPTPNVAPVYTDSRIDYLIQEIRLLKQAVAVRQAPPVQVAPTPTQVVVPTPQQNVYVAPSAPPTTDSVKVQPVAPVVTQPKVRYQASTVLDVRKDLGPDPQDVKPRYKNDELK